MEKGDRHMPKFVIIEIVEYEYEAEDEESAIEAQINDETLGLSVGFVAVRDRYSEGEV